MSRTAPAGDRDDPQDDAEAGLDEAPPVLVDSRRASILLAAFYGLLAAALAVTALALGMRDPHLFNRLGGLTVTLSLSLTAMQFGVDRWIEMRRESESPSSREMWRNLGFPESSARNKQRLAKRLLKRNMEHVRFRILIHSLSCAALGEFFHTFGDLIQALIRTPGSHE